jgi:K(+)-stimulated pyrophosphate-energized sodium pump
MDRRKASILLLLPCALLLILVGCRAAPLANPVSSLVDSHITLAIASTPTTVLPTFAFALDDVRTWAILASLAALGFVAYLIADIMRQSEGSERMRTLGMSIRHGANAFMRREFIVMGVFTAIMVVILALFIEPRPQVAIAYFLGTVVAALAGWIGMSIAVRANTRTANAAVNSWARALRLAFSSGAVMGFTVVGLGLLSLTLITIAFPDSYVWLGFVFGSTTVALFLRVGGGIYTKSADIGADLVGKVEAGIPEDDARNPATIADNVGDNVGDIAGMGSDLYESYVSSLVAAMVLGAFVYGLQGAMLPLLLGAVGIISSIIGTLFVRPGEFNGTFEQQVHKAHAVMNRGIYVSNAIMVIAGLVVINLFMPVDGMSIFWTFIVGLVTGFLIGPITEYYTSEHPPVLGIARASETGPAIAIIEGLYVGMLSTVAPIIIIAIATVVAYSLAGLLGIAIASIGMVINLGMLLSMDCYGPIADNAAGLAEMADLGEDVRARCEALDAVGNSTAALGKGFAISSAALAALAWLATYFEVADVDIASITQVDVVAGLFIGAMTVFLFSALTMKGVSNGAFAMVNEVRRQFRDMPGIIEGTTPPDYVSCVDISTRQALRAMLLPGVLVIIIPLAVGFAIGAEAVAGLLVGSLIVGLPMAIMMANSGGAWDNAKKHIEAGNLGGKGSEAHKASVIGDTVGDPFKDTVGPSLDILIKLVGKMAVIFAPLFSMVHWLR